MKLKKMLPLAAAALACGVLAAAPLSAFALAPDQADPETLGQENYSYYYSGDGGYISYDDTYGYICLDKDELYLTIPSGSRADGDWAFPMCAALP